MRQSKSMDACYGKRHTNTNTHTPKTGKTTTGTHKSSLNDCDEHPTKDGVDNDDNDGIDGTDQVKGARWDDRYDRTKDGTAQFTNKATGLTKTRNRNRKKCDREKHRRKGTNAHRYTHTHIRIRADRHSKGSIVASSWAMKFHRSRRMSS